MARPVRHIDNEIDADAGFMAPSHQVHHAPAISPAPASMVAVPTGGSLNVFGGAVGNGGVFGGGVLAQTTGTYQQVNQDDNFNGTPGDDRFLGGYGNDSMFGFAGKDALFGEQGADFIAGGTGDDWLDGGSEDDIVYGEAGKDHIFGGLGNDRLNGGTENDIIDGGAGADIMTGGPGADSYMAGTVEVGLGGQLTVQKDTITDFSTAQGSDDILFLRDAVDKLTDFHERFGGNSLPHVAVQNGYVVFVTHGNPFFGDYGTTVYVDSNGSEAGGTRFAVAELDRVAFSDLHFGLPGYGGNLFV